jgi:glutamate N-acetyltransferase/amino-acid N-acetyltransferase
LSPEGAEDAAAAIMTTDTHAKICVRAVEAGGRVVTVGGMAKGAGMIAPRLDVAHATMLAFITTDAEASPEFLRETLDAGLDGSFNGITVDGSTSTNDTVLLFANGAAGVDVAGSAPFVEAVHEVMAELAYAIVADGEGSTKVIRIIVRGAATDAQARTAAREVANSLLFRAAIWGGDPNAGRVIQSIGQAPGVDFDPDAVRVWIGGVQLAHGGIEVTRTAEAAQSLSADEILVEADLGLGGGTGEMLTCDLTPEYVKFNADYTT